MYGIGKLNGLVTINCSWIITVASLVVTTVMSFWIIAISSSSKLSPGLTLVLSSLNIAFLCLKVTACTWITQGFRKCYLSPKSISLVSTVKM